MKDANNNNVPATITKIKPKIVYGNPSMLPKLAEWHVYGNEQQGRFLTKYPEELSPTYYGMEVTEDIKKGIFKRQVGEKAYELKDHLGNVRVTFSDIKIPTGIANPQFEVDLLSKSEYFPYGMVINDLSFNLSDNRYGFGETHELDNEVKGGVGNHLSFGDFGYDTRVARRFNLDPIDQIFISNYAGFGNNPIFYSDPSGYKPCNDCDTPLSPNIEEKSSDKGFWSTVGEGIKNTASVMGGVLNSVISNNAPHYSEKNIVNINDYKVSDDTKHYFQVGEKAGHQITIGLATLELGAGVISEVGGGLLLFPSFGTSGVLISGGVALSAHSIWSSTNAAIKLQNMNSESNGSGGGSEKTADELLPGKAKKSNSYSSELGNKTLKQLEALAKQGNQKAKQMIKLIKQQPRLSQKSRG